ncbi:MAG: DUF4174 domain-containing protein [Cocleimonas sp.]
MANLKDNIASNEKVSSALAQYAWKKRQLIIFAPNSDHKQYKLFKEYQIDFSEDFLDRKLQTWFVIGDNVLMMDTTIEVELKNNDFREIFQVNKDEFRLILVGYDQVEKLRLGEANIDLIFSKIDQMPMRQSEIQDK